MTPALKDNDEDDDDQDGGNDAVDNDADVNGTANNC